MSIESWDTTMRFYYKTGEQEHGPVTLTELRHLRKTRVIKGTTYVRKAHGDEWVIARDFWKLVRDEGIPTKRLISHESVGAKIRQKLKSYYSTREEPIAWGLSAVIVCAVAVIFVVLKSVDWMPVLVACMWIIGVLACIVLCGLFVMALNDEKSYNQLKQVAIFIFLIFFLLPVMTQLNTGYTPATSDFQRKYRAKQELKEKLPDPRSFEVIEERVEGKLVYIKYRAKNSFGGYFVDDYVTEIR